MYNALSLLTVAVSFTCLGSKGANATDDGDAKKKAGKKQSECFSCVYARIRA